MINFIVFAIIGGLMTVSSIACLIGHAILFWKEKKLADKSILRSEVLLTPAVVNLVGGIAVILLAVFNYRYL